MSMSHHNENAVVGATSFFNALLPNNKTSYSRAKSRDGGQMRIYTKSHTLTYARTCLGGKVNPPSPTL